MHTLLRLLSSIGVAYETFAKMHLLAVKLVTLAGPEMTLEGALPPEEEDGASENKDHRADSSTPGERC